MHCCFNSSISIASRTPIRNSERLRCLLLGSICVVSRRRASIAEFSPVLDEKASLSLSSTSGSCTNTRRSASSNRLFDPWRSNALGRGPRLCVCFSSLSDEIRYLLAGKLACSGLRRRQNDHYRKLERPAPIRQPHRLDGAAPLRAQPRACDRNAFGSSRLPPRRPPACRPQSR